MEIGSIWANFWWQGVNKLKQHSSRAALLLILLLAAFLRYWQLDTLPPGLYHDEAYYGLDALSLLQGKSFPQFYEGWELYVQDAHAERPPTPTRFPVFFEGNYGREPLHVYLVALSIKLFGVTPFAIRFVSATAGVLGVLTTYLAATAIFNREGRRDMGSHISSPFSNFIPLFAAFTLAVLYPALHFSRFGIRAMTFVPIATLAVFCFWRAVDSGGKTLLTPSPRHPLTPSSPWFAAAGFFLGLSLYTYASARLLPLLFLTFVPLWFWQDRQAMRQYWPNVVLMAVVSLIIAGPLLLFFARYPYFFVFRTAYVANRGLGVVEGRPWLTWLLNTGHVFRGFFWLGETHLRHNLPGRPYLDPIQAVLFVAGVGQLLRGWWRPRRVFLLLWLLVMLLPTILSGDAPHFGRMTGAAPVVAILTAAGADWLWRRLVRRPQSSVLSPQSSVLSPQSLVLSPQSSVLSPQSSVRNPQLIAGYGFLLAALVISPVLTVRDYFGRYAGHPDVARDFYLPDWTLGRYAVAQPLESDLYLTPTQEEMATIYYALADPERLGSYSGGAHLLVAGQPGRPALYLVRPEDEAALRGLMDFFPAGSLGQAQDGFIPFHVPATAPRVTADHMVDFSWAGHVSLRGWSLVREDGRLAVTLFWQAETAMDHDYTAFVHLLDETEALVAQLDRPPAGYPTSAWRSGEIVVDTYIIELPARQAGVYTLQTGFYDRSTLERLGGAAVLGRVAITE